MHSGTGSTTCERAVRRSTSGIRHPGRTLRRCSPRRPRGGRRAGSEGAMSGERMGEEREAAIREWLASGDNASLSCQDCDMHVMLREIDRLRAELAARDAEVARAIRAIDDACALMEATLA